RPRTRRGFGPLPLWSPARAVPDGAALTPLLFEKACHGTPQDEHVAAEVAARVAEQKMQAQLQALPEGQALVHRLRNEPRSFLAAELGYSRNHLRNQPFSRHSRSAMRARYSSTQQWVDVIASSLQISAVSAPRCSRIRNTWLVRAGRAARHFSSAARNCFSCNASSGCGQDCGGSRQCPVSSNSASKSSTDS